MVKTQILTAHRSTPLRRSYCAVEVSGTQKRQMYSGTTRPYERLGEQFLPLVTELRTLTESFQVDEIVERLEEMQE